MHLHILGICGTFMAGIAALARELGHQVSGSDANAWPPMSTQLEQLGIRLQRGYEPAHLDPAPDLVIVGNVVTRGNPAMEHVLNAGLPYISGPQWLAENVLRGRHVLAVAGTHGKTTTSSLLAWMLDQGGLEPGFLIGGVPLNFGVSARLGGGRYFVVEADEYDTAFFDKRSKFVHYGPRTAILNNLEFDHADIFPDLAAIERQFHHLVRTVPSQGRLIVNGGDAALAHVLKMGCWTPVETFAPQSSSPLITGAAHWTIHTAAADRVEICTNAPNAAAANGTTPLAGPHNLSNALAATAAAAHVGITPAVALQALASFQNVRRRLEKVGTAGEIEVYDDFAHHPTAVAVTVAGLKERILASGQPGRILAVLEPRSNTMRLGSHAGALGESLAGAAHSFVFARADLNWDAQAALGPAASVYADAEAMIAAIVSTAQPFDRILVMSNGDFGGMPSRILAALKARPASQAS